MAAEINPTTGKKVFNFASYISHCYFTLLQCNVLEHWLSLQKRKLIHGNVIPTINFMALLIVALPHTNFLK
jgi:hypothetical protein